MNKLWGIMFSKDKGTVFFMKMLRIILKTINGVTVRFCGMVMVFLILTTGISTADDAQNVNPLALRETSRQLPEVAFQNAHGTTVRLGDFHEKVVLLNIWATWCGPCREEMPTLDRLQAKLGGADFEVVALSIDSAGLSVVEAFYRKIGIRNLALYIDERGKSLGLLGVMGLPTTLLIDRSGHEIARMIGPAEWDSQEMVALIRTHIAKADKLQTPTALTPQGPRSKDTTHEQ